MSELKVGMKFERSFVVEESQLASKVGSGLAPVLATPYLVNFFETVCSQGVEKCLKEGESTVGSSIKVTHTAPTPPGLTVTVKCELVEIDRRRLVFKGEAFDDKEKIGTCEHERFIINFERFMAKAEAKKK